MIHLSHKRKVDENADKSFSGGNSSLCSYRCPKENNSGRKKQQM